VKSQIQQYKELCFGARKKALFVCLYYFESHRINLHGCLLFTVNNEIIVAGNRARSGSVCMERVTEQRTLQIENNRVHFGRRLYYENLYIFIIKRFLQLFIFLDKINS
jgi:hypothetical protein